MTEFMDTGRIRELCEEMKRSLPARSRTTISEKLLRCFGIPAGEEVYLTHDDTLFHSGKDGFAVTERGFYVSRMFTDQVIFTAFDTLAEAEDIYVIDYVVYADRVPVIYCSAGGDDIERELLRFVQRVRQASR